MTTNNRKKTPNIMADLMSGTSSANAHKEHDNNTIKKDSSKEVYISSNKAIKNVSKESSKYESDNKEIKAALLKLEDGRKEKATFNLSLTTLEALEETWLYLRRAAKGQNKITKTLIVEAALEMAMSDLSNKGKSSSFYRKVEKINS